MACVSRLCHGSERSDATITTDWHDGRSLAKSAIQAAAAAAAAAVHLHRDAVGVGVGPSANALLLLPLVACSGRVASCRVMHSAPVGPPTARPPGMHALAACSPHGGAQVRTGVGFKTERMCESVVDANGGRAQVAR